MRKYNQIDKITNENEDKKMENILGLLALVLFYTVKVLNFCLKVVFFPITIHSMISAAKTERKIEENIKYWENQGRKQRFYKVKFDKFFNYRDYNSNKDLYVGNGMYLYIVDAFMLPEEASEKGYLTKEEAEVKYYNKKVEICKILNLPIPLV